MENLINLRIYFLARGGKKKKAHDWCHETPFLLSEESPVQKLLLYSSCIKSSCERHQGYAFKECPEPILMFKGKRKSFQGFHKFQREEVSNLGVHRPCPHVETAWFHVFGFTVQT